MPHRISGHAEGNHRPKPSTFHQCWSLSSRLIELGSGKNRLGVLQGFDLVLACLPAQIEVLQEEVTVVVHLLEVRNNVVQLLRGDGLGLLGLLELGLQLGL